MRLIHVVLGACLGKSKSGGKVVERAADQHFRIARCTDIGGTCEYVLDRFGL
jgi:hypothetical protein